MYTICTEGNNGSDGRNHSVCRGENQDGRNESNPRPHVGSNNGNDLNGGDNDPGGGRNGGGVGAISNRQLHPNNEENRQIYNQEYKGQ